MVRVFFLDWCIIKNRPVLEVLENYMADRVWTITKVARNPKELPCWTALSLHNISIGQKTKDHFAQLFFLTYIIQRQVNTRKEKEKNEYVYNR